MSYDVFVSYAHVDDVPLPGAAEGWVTTLVKTVQTLVTRKLGRPDAFKIWMDPRLAGNVPLTPEILGSLHQAELLLMVYSPAYRASEWCRREMNAFLDYAGALGTRLFVVERDREEREPEIADLRGYRFWVADPLSGRTRTLGEPVPQPHERLYYDVIGDLAEDLAAELGRRRQAEGQHGADRPAVLLAETTDDLDPAREEIRRYLEQQRVRVLPGRICYTRTSADAFAAEVDRDLARSALFVQLLSVYPGKRPPNSSRTFVQIQHERALAAGRPVLQWRAAGIDPASLTDAEHQALLCGPDVVAVGLEELKPDIVARLRPKPERHDPAAGDRLVFVNAEASDLPVARDLSRLIGACGLGSMLPLANGDPAKMRHDLEQNLLECDKLMIVYGATTPEWVREQVRQARKVIHRRDRKLDAWAIYAGPPPEKDPLGFELPNVRTIDGSRGLNEQALRAFLGAAR